MRAASEISFGQLLTVKLKDYVALTKLRLTSLVVFTSAIGYALGAGEFFSTVNLLLISLGGLLVTASANTINQIIEKDIDPLMNRTKDRPVAAGRMKVTEAILAAGITGVLGLALITYFFNPTAGVLSAISLFSYAFIYTPLKRVSPFAVFVGAIPGGLPPMIGYVAATGTIDFVAVLLFAVQFFWQFPHFWAIAWLAFDDYKKADIMLLPSTGGKDKLTTIYNLLYSAVLVVVSFIPFIVGLNGNRSLVIMSIMGIYFMVSAVNFFRKRTDQSAKGVLYASFAWLPIVLLTIYFDKL